MTVSGFSIIAGAPSTDRSTPFRAIDPARGEQTPPTYFAAAHADVDAAAKAATLAFETTAPTPASLARLLETCADRIAGLGDELIAIASQETGLMPPRITSERDRTVNQFRFFAALVREGSWVDAVIDHGDPNRAPMPRPDLRRVRRPLGPVAVFGASNFPLAYSAGGGDTASALATGCPVVVKGHPSHPGTGELVAAAISRAVKECGLHAGTYSYLHAGAQREIEVGKELITHPAIRAAGFTGSLTGGMALARLGAGRPHPIPVFSEMGSTNPVFILPGIAEKDPAGIAQRLHASITNSTGQMCTCPGLVFVTRSAGGEALLGKLAELIAGSAAMPMLSPKIRAGYISRLSQIASVPGVRETRGGEHASPAPASDNAVPVFGRPALMVATVEAFLAHHTLSEECFGPAALGIVCGDTDQMLAAARRIEGSLTGTICADPDSDAPLAGRLARILEDRVGRVIFNGVPTGVEVTHSMVHGGPYPATNQPHTSAVGPLALQRWCRPVCFQNCPDGLLSAALQEANPLKITRTVDGKPDRPA